MCQCSLFRLFSIELCGYCRSSLNILLCFLPCQFVLCVVSAGCLLCSYVGSFSWCVAVVLLTGKPS